MAAAVAVKVVEPTTQENDANFEAAFNQIAALEDKPIPQEGIAAAVPAAEATTQTAEKIAVEAVEEGLPTPEEEAARVAAEVAAAEAAKTVTPKKEAASEIGDDDLVRRLAGMIKKAEPVGAVKSETTVEPQSPFTSEEAEFLDTYTKDYGDIARAEALIRRAEYQTVVGYIFQEVSKELQPLMQMVRTLSERTHLGDLQQVVPDYNDLRTQVIDWAGKQPAYLQPAYNYVIQHGTVDEVKDLIERFKQSTGIQVVPAVTAKKETELAPVARQAAAALAPVSSKRSAVVTTPGPDDFDSAFVEAARTL